MIGSQCWSSPPPPIGPPPPFRSTRITSSIPTQSLGLRSCWVRSAALLRGALRGISARAASTAPVSTSQFLSVISDVLDLLRHQTGSAAQFPPADLITGSLSRLSQHKLSAQVFEREATRVTTLLPSDAHRARIQSAASPHAGAWLGAIPTSGFLTAQPCHFRRALQLRASIPLRELTGGRRLLPLRCPC